MKSEAIQRFWREFCEISGVNPETPHQAWYFGNNSDLARRLAELVLRGDKRATTTLVEAIEKDLEYGPIKGGYSVVTDYEGIPVCVIQTTEIRILPFDEVDAEYAFEEGEGDKSLDYWKKAHHRFFTEDAAENDLAFHEKSLIACERFRLLYPKNL